jgi:lactoylglutathione lyase
MQIEHIAVWTSQLEQMMAFYERYFTAQASNRYENHTKHTASYFLSFSEGTRLELMTKLDRGIDLRAREHGGSIFHIAISVGSEHAVDELTEEIKKDGYQVIDGPRRTGDGYYESLILDPDGNSIEITV